MDLVKQEIDDESYNITDLVECKVEIEEDIEIPVDKSAQTFDPLAVETSSKENKQKRVPTKRNWKKSASCNSSSKTAIGSTVRKRTKNTKIEQDLHAATLDQVQQLHVAAVKSTNTNNSDNATTTILEIKPALTDADLHTKNHCDATLKSKNKGPACTVSNPLEAWILLFDEPLLTLLIQNVNEEIRKRRKIKIKTKTTTNDVAGNADAVSVADDVCAGAGDGVIAGDAVAVGAGNLKKIYTTTNRIEMSAWIGLNYLCAVLGSSAANDSSISDMWSSEYGNIVFQVAMTWNRFKLIADCLRLSTTISQTIWRKFFINCRSFYAPAGKCGIVEYLLKKNDKNSPFQFEIVELNAQQHENALDFHLINLRDINTSYIYNALVGTKNCATTAEIQKLIVDLKGTERNIQLTKRYAHMDLADKFQKYGLNFQIVDNVTESSVKNYSVRITKPANSTINWSLDYVQTLLDYASTNAHVLLNLSQNCATTLKQRDFLLQLGLQLVKQQLIDNLKNPKFTLLKKLQISDLLGVPTDKLLCDAALIAVQNKSVAVVNATKLALNDKIVLMPTQLEKRTRCRRCPSSSNCLSRKRCQQCGDSLCQRHLILRCFKCTGLPVDETQRQRKATNS